MKIFGDPRFSRHHSPPLKNGTSSSLQWCNRGNFVLIFENADAIIYIQPQKRRGYDDMRNFSCFIPLGEIDKQDVCKKDMDPWTRETEKSFLPSEVTFPAFATPMHSPPHHAPTREGRTTLIIIFNFFHKLKETVKKGLFFVIHFF